MALVVLNAMNLQQWSHGGVASMPWIALLLSILSLAGIVGLAFFLKAAGRCAEADHAHVRRLTAILDAQAEGMIVLSADGKITACNKAAADILGAPCEALIGRALPPDGCRFIRDDGSLLMDERNPIFNTRSSGAPSRGAVIGVQRPDESLVWLSISSMPLLCAGGEKPCGVVCTCADITDRRQYELAIMAREAELRRVVASAPLVLWSVNRHQRLTNAFGENISDGARWADFVGRPATELFPDDQGFPEDLSRAMAGERFTTFIRSRGFVFETRFYPNRDINGLVVGASGVSIDVTARFRAEAEQAGLRDALREAAEEWRATFDAIDFPLLVVAHDGRVRRINRAAQALWNKPFEKIVGARLPNPDQGAPWNVVSRSVELFRETGLSVTTQEHDEAGERYWDVTASPFSDANGGAGGVIILVRDVSRIVALRESLRQSERMSVMGQLVGGVAHQVRNPLFGISSTLDAFDAEFGESTEFREYSEMLRHEARRLSTLMNDLLEYGKPASTTRAKGLIRDVILGAARSMDASARQAGVELDVSLPEDLPALQMDRRRIEEAVGNLIENAVQHSPRDGKVRIFARVEVVDGNPAVLCGIEDAGPGFRPEDMRRLFEPFFSRRSGGTGLGLSIAQRIIDDHGGRIVADNRAEGGAVVTITLPLRSPARTGSKSSA